MIVKLNQAQLQEAVIAWAHKHSGINRVQTARVTIHGSWILVADDGICVSVEIKDPPENVHVLPRVTHCCGSTNPNRNGVHYHCGTCERRGCAVCEKRKL